MKTTRVLVTYASRMGSTAEIAQQIAERIDRSSLVVELLPVQQAGDAHDYDAVVLGSAVYFRRWDRAAVSYLRHHAAALQHRSVWLFQSGPVGADPSPKLLTPPPVVEKLRREIGVETPVMVFGGNLDPARATGRLQRWVAGSELAGDSRDCDVIDGWATDIAAQLLEYGPIPVAPGDA